MERGGGGGGGDKLSALSTSSLSVFTGTSYQLKIWLLYVFVLPFNWGQEKYWPITDR